ncbi:MAG: hypothetical protein KBC84_09040 [Proteobacteria bacterium]|nr:hypothetical protein [Pseudomonadota bacterium]
MYLLELALNTFLTLSLGAVIFLPLGIIFENKLFAGLSTKKIAFASGVACSLIFYVLVFAVVIFLAVPTSYYPTLFRLLVFVSFVVASYFYKERIKITGEGILITLLFYLYVLLCQGMSAFPNLNYRDVTAINTEVLTNLPSDNIIPYQVSRYITENIDPNKTILTSDWKLADRGPFAGIINAVVFSVLDVKESNHWEKTTIRLFFVYQTIACALNLLSLFLVYAICADYFGRQTAIVASIMTSLNYFYLVNIIFTWPKFLMSFYILLALCFINIKGRQFWAGVFAAAGLLSHDSALFYIVSLAACLVFRFLKDNSYDIIKTIKQTKELLFISLRMFLGFLLVYSPWVIAKKFYLTNSSKLLYFHLFCLTEETADAPTLYQGLIDYYRLNSLQGILKIKLSNILYPINIFFEGFSLRGIFHSPLTTLNNLGQYYFLRYWLVVGVVVILLVLVSAIKLRKDKISDCLFGLLLMIVLPLLVASISFGCPDSTASHHWCYPAFLFSMIIAARVATVSGVWVQTLLAINTAFLTIISYLVFGFHSQAKLFLHASNTYIYFTIGMLLLTIAVYILLIFQADNK